MKELWVFIDKSLAKGFIQSAKSTMPALVLFREKTDESLRLCVDYRGMNCICVENMYPLPFRWTC